jgi:predicted GNAT family acetyltransferase
MGEIKHVINGTKGSFNYEVDGKTLAEMVYNMAGEQKMIIEHTDVDDSLRGQGVGKKLLAELVAYVRATNIKVIPLCPFAKATLDKATEWQDILA